MKEISATNAVRLEEILEPKWYDDQAQFRMISKINSSGVDRIRRILDSRGKAR